MFFFVLRLKVNPAYKEEGSKTPRHTKMRGGKKLVKGRTGDRTENLFAVDSERSLYGVEEFEVKKA